MTKLSTREFTDNIMLMTLVSSKKENKSRVVERLIDKAGDLKSDIQPAYNVEIKVNGIELDFNDFTEEVTRQLDSLVVEEAGKLIHHQVMEATSHLTDALREMEERIKLLSQATESRVRQALGLPPREEY